MDKFVLREPREFANQANQMPGYMMHNENTDNIHPPPGVYLTSYGAEAPMHRTNSGYMSASHSHSNMNVISPYVSTNNTVTGQGQMISGIEPRYLAAYGDDSAAYIAGAGQYPVLQRMNDQTQMSAFSDDPYQRRQFLGADRMRNVQTSFGQSPHTADRRGGQEAQQRSNQDQNSMSKAGPYTHCNSANRTSIGYEQRRSTFTPQPPGNQEQTDRSKRVISFELPQCKVANLPVSLPASFKAEMEPVKNEVQNPTKTRFEKLKALYNSGPRVFSGPVDKVLKWHKALQEIGLLVYYEIVAKCVSVRPGETCAKNLVVRDENGPAMQVVYYEIDFLLPELKPPCTIRVIGRMMPGTCRLQAFHVRLATGDDVATLPRRAAVASHHVAKLCKEYGTHTV